MSKSFDEGVPGQYGQVCVRKERRQRQKLIVFELSMEYAKNTTLHGLRYVTEKLTILEKLFWLYTFIACAVVCVFLIRNIWVKWRNSPVIVTLNEQLVPVGDVPFPSVTICPQNKNRKSVYDFYENYQKYAPLLMNGSFDIQNPYLEKLEDIGLICHGGLYNKYLNKILSQMLKREMSNESLVEHILQVAPDTPNVFEKCIFRGRRFTCGKLFKKVLTSEGVCFNFNSLGAHEIFRMEVIQKDYKYLDRNESSNQWTLEKGYSKESYTSRLFQTYPYRGKDNGAKPDLQILLKEEEKDRMCNSMNKGFKIYVQHPADMPQNSLYYYAALPNQKTSMAIKVKMLNTSPSLKGYDAEVRQCYFQSGDRELKYFRIYTASNCRLECQSIYTYNECKCVFFNMPHSNSSEICTQKQRECVARALDKLANDSMRIDSTTCRCLPACDSVQYDAEILKINLENNPVELTKVKTTRRKQKKLTGISFSKIELYFKEHAFVSTRRSELFGITDFLANCGGLLGLFHGFSFLSLVEIIYFVTLRLYFTLKKDLKEEKARRKQN